MFKVPFCGHFFFQRAVCTMAIIDYNTKLNSPWFSNVTKYNQVHQNAPFRLSITHFQIVDPKCYNIDTNTKQLSVEKTKSNTKFQNTK